MSTSQGNEPFYPDYTTGINVSPAAGAANSVIDAQRLNKQIRLVNTGAAICYVRTYRASDGAVAATVADYAMPGGLVSIISKPMDHDTLSYISATGTTLSAMCGNGR